MVGRSPFFHASQYLFIISSFSLRFAELIAEVSGRIINIAAKTAAALTRTEAIGFPFCNCSLVIAAALEMRVAIFLRLLRFFVV
jgi:hypothetical protein